MFQERDIALANWTRTPPTEIALTRPSGMNDEDVAIHRRIYQKLDKALTNAEKYQDLNGVFTDFLDHHEVVIRYTDAGFDRSDTEHRTKLTIIPREDISALEIQGDTGFATFIDCLTFAGQCFLAGQEGFGLPNDRMIIKTDIDTWLRKGHKVRLFKDDEEGIILEAQREWDNFPVLRVIGDDFVMNLRKFNSLILSEEILKIAENSEFMFGKDGNSSPAPVLIKL